ncbi:MAG: transglycosylase SLT domain-containing protein, partial [Deferribacterota bacterium]|nr:transglycosylase SLT domain-containing protein [Deferribacterota bacterium]
MKKNLYITLVLTTVFLCIYLTIFIANNICSYQISLHKEKISKNTEILKNLEKKYNKLKKSVKEFTELFNIYDYLKINFRETNKTLMEVAITIFRESKKNNIDPYLVLSVIKVESSFIADSFSNKGAIGLMQLKPKTAFYIVDKIEDVNLSTAHELYDPVLNIKI